MLCKNIHDLALEPAVIHGGKGECRHATVFPGDEFKTPVRFLNYTILPPGAGIGAHAHGNDNEVYVVLAGEGIYTENGQACPVRKGSIMVNAPYAVHELLNTSAADMEILVLEAYN